MNQTMRWTVVAIVILASAFCAAGCNGPGSIDSRWICQEPMLPGSGRLILDARRDGDKLAYGFGYVLFPMDCGPSSPDYKVLMEPHVGRWYAGQPRPEGIPLVFYLKPGRYGIDVFGTGACFRGRDIVVKGGEEVIYRANMEPGGSIEGVILGPATGNPLPGVIVWRPLDRGYGTDSKEWDPKNSYEASRICKTSDEGYFYIPDLPPGEHLIVIYAPDIGWMEKKVTIVDGKKLQLNPIRFARN
ncbi:MAG: hypothetical protein FD180_4447 [Planctomycetota bacterium]|nr:MAG: hypothetical protein FD180_4447 [Planctomycetota bacterium]